MCPSYMATREEEHATRGRANALVKALSQPDPRAALGDERLHEILDLCLECKACKSECPLERRHGDAEEPSSSRTTRTSTARRCARGCSGRSGALNRARRRDRAAVEPARGRGARRCSSARSGIDRRRPLPRFERDTLLRWDRGAPAAAAAPRGEVVFLADSFTTFTEPAIGRAAIELLERGGLARAAGERRLLRAREHLQGAARPGARRWPRRWSTRLAPDAERGVPIVGCEPSCLLTLREEHLALLPGDPRARAVAGQTRLVEELLVEAIDDGALRAARRLADVAGRPILFHGHCHQKALAGTAATVALLERIPGAEVDELDAGCCGMAGSFGFEAEHYDLSMQIGEHAAVPGAARRAAPGTLVAATGVSCRQQIGHGAGPDRAPPGRARGRGGRARQAPAARRDLGSRQRRRSARRAHRPWPLPGGGGSWARAGSTSCSATGRSRPKRCARTCPPEPAARPRRGHGVDLGRRVRGPRHPPARPAAAARRSARFPELNVRTYVTRGGRPGDLLPQPRRDQRARGRRPRGGLFRLPYLRAQMAIASDGPWTRYRSERRDPRGAPARFGAR